jgi:opacity protein-like surface antigen
VLNRAFAALLGAAIGFLTALPAGAQDVEESEVVAETAKDPVAAIDYGADRFYFHLGYTHGIDRKLARTIDRNRDEFIKAVSQPLGDVSVSSSPGFNFRVGRKVLPNLAIEVQAEYLADFKVSIGNFGTLRAEALSFTVNAKIPLLTGRFQPYGLVGGGAMWVYHDLPYPQVEFPIPEQSGNPTESRGIVDADKLGGVFRIGTGIDFYITEHVAINGELTWVSSQGQKVNDIKFIAIQAGLIYLF